MKGFLVLPALLILWFGTPALDDFAKGLEAYQRGDYTAAINEWLPVGEQGDADAQVMLGAMYEEGQGVTQVYYLRFWI